MFHTVWLCLCFWSLVGVFGEPVSVNEGDSVTLNSGLTEIKDDDEIQWRFGYKSIAKICVTNGRITVNNVPDGRFRDRLKLDNQTGSLTITNTRREHTGRYELQTNCLRKSFILTVQYCSLCMFEDTDEISVMVGYNFNLNTGLTTMKDGDVIQWRFENTLIAEINVTADRFTVSHDVLDGRFRDRLKLDKQTGILTITDMRTDHTGVYERETNGLRKSFIFTINSHLPVPVISRNSSQCSSSSSEYHPNLQHTCADSARGCDSVEAVLRLVATALVGVAAAAAVIVLVYDIISRRAELDKARPTSET